MDRQCRRVRVNIASCTGETLMATITGPGGDLTEFDRWAWNADAWRRFQHLRDLAGKQARREVPGITSRLVAWVPELQDRGMLHFHLVFEAGTLLERRWAERYCKYLRANAVHHGFGRQFKKGSWGRTHVGRYLSKYLSKSTELRTMWEAGHGTMPGRAFYVSRRLTDTTGCTIRRLRLTGRLWAAERITVPVGAWSDWSQYERAFGRPLNRAELLCLPGASERGPPGQLAPVVANDSARSQTTTQTGR